MTNIESADSFAILLCEGFGVSVGMELDFRAGIHDYSLRKLKMICCLAEMTQAYGDGVVSLSTISRSNDAFETARKNLNDESLADRGRNRDLERGIVSFLEAEPYTFAHYLAEQLAQPNITIQKMPASGTPDGKACLPLGSTRTFSGKQRHASSIGSSDAEVP